MSKVKLTKGEVVKDLLEVNGKSQLDVIRELKEKGIILGKSTLSNIVNDKGDNHISSIKILAEYFGVSSDCLLGFDTPDGVSDDEYIAFASGYTGINPNTLKKLHTIKCNSDYIEADFIKFIDYLLDKITSTEYQLADSVMNGTRSTEELIELYKNDDIDSVNNAEDKAEEINLRLNAEKYNISQRFNNLLNGFFADNCELSLSDIEKLEIEFSKKMASKRLENYKNRKGGKE